MIMEDDFMDEDQELFLTKDEQIRIEALKSAVDSFVPCVEPPISVGSLRVHEDIILIRAKAFENYIRNGKES
jgi:hypothetical protein